MKVILKSGDEFQVSLVAMQQENQICVAFTNINNYDELIAKATATNMKEFKYYSQEDQQTDNVDGTFTTLFAPYEVFSGFTKFNTAKITPVADGTLDVAMYFDRESEIELRISETEAAQTDLELALCEVYEMLLGGM